MSEVADASGKSALDTRDRVCSGSGCQGRPGRRKANCSVTRQQWTHGSRPTAPGQSPTAVEQSLAPNRKPRDSGPSKGGDSKARIPRFERCTRPAPRVNPQPLSTPKGPMVKGLSSRLDTNGCVSASAPQKQDSCPETPGRRLTSVTAVGGGNRQVVTRNRRRTAVNCRRLVLYRRRLVGNGADGRPQRMCQFKEKTRAPKASPGGDILQTRKVEVEGRELRSGPRPTRR